MFHSFIESLSEIEEQGNQMEEQEMENDRNEEQQKSKQQLCLAKMKVNKLREELKLRNLS